MLNEEYSQQLINYKTELQALETESKNEIRELNKKIENERTNYLREHEWDAHQSSIAQCQALGNHQAAYFIERDLIFRRDVYKNCIYENKIIFFIHFFSA